MSKPLPIYNQGHTDPLGSALREARHLFAKDRAQGIFGGRQGACVALNAVIKHLRAIRPDCYDDLYPLLVLAAELADLHETGVVGPMLKKPEACRGRPRDPVEKGEILNQVASAAVEILIDDGLEEGDANKRVAKKLRLHAIDVAPDTVGNMRSACRKAWGKGNATLFDDLWSSWQKNPAQVRRGRGVAFVDSLFDQLKDHRSHQSFKNRIY